MGIALTREQVLALAPDAASAKAATGLLSDSKWETLGVDDEALWGECKGSGAKPYQTQVDLTAMVSRCSCPSRKFPCKHGLALLLLSAQKHARLLPGERPAWVSQWMDSRRDKAAKKEQAAAEKPETDPAAAAAASARRETTRWKRIDSGSAELQRWIADQFRRGLAQAGPEQQHEWRAMAARMVDAQAPGLARRVEAAAEHDALDTTPAQRHAQRIERLGLLQLINAAVSRRTQLNPAREADLRIALGWGHDKDELTAHADHVDDCWQVLGQCIDDRDAKLSERRVWLRGRHSGRYALVQDYAYNGRGWEGLWRDGASCTATLAFHPGSVPLRAVAGTQTDAASHDWPEIALDAAIDQASTWFATNPWLQQVPMLIDAGIPTLDGDARWLRTVAGSLPLRLDTASSWSLLAFSGGHPLRVMGEWDGRALRPLSATLPGDAARRWTADGIGSAA
ncbi:SWIM zinc finger family protein [Montanilutibacter psychrotolerans]|uniref:SWIM zinc finger family protein n=1 Tax=Montanilutibacter psychrotolerans TaxID=1327343 RepID=A0A3M8ST00_9GAMM|nr:SWIM zinc finger family protein [Lysobacter psychrotolerans]RNF82616.1 SWIM zinc finger family protein [Lysobacter psychrotolerans]